MPSLPSSLALTNIADGALIVAADHRNNYTAIQSAVNQLIAALSGGSTGQVLQALTASSVGFTGAAAAVAGANIGSANTDLSYPGGLATNYVAVTTVGGTLRSIGAAPIAGVTLTLKNANTAGFIRLLHATSGGSGAQLSIIGAGHKFLAPGQSIQFVYDGTNWVEVNRPAQELICDLTLSGAQATFDTDAILGVANGLPQVYSHLRFVLLGRSDTAATSVSAALRINNDSAANYGYQYDSNILGTLTGNNGSAQTSAYLGTVTAASSTAGLAGHTIADIPDYALSTFQKTYTAQNQERSQGRLDVIGGWWASSSAVTRLTVLLGAGSYIAASRFMLYGIT